MSEQIKIWADNGKRFTDAELKQIQELVDKRRAAGEDFCPYRRTAKRGVKMCKIMPHKCWYDSDYSNCITFGEWYTEELGSKFEDLLPAGCPF